MADIVEHPVQLERVSIRDLMDFLIETCRIAIECGCSSNRIENLVARLGDAWGYQVESAALPTAVWITIRGRGQQLLELVRVKAWAINLNRLALLNDLVDDVENHRIYLDEAVEKLKAIRISPSPYPSWLTLIAGGGSSLALIYTSGGRNLELAVGFVIGIVCQLTSLLFSKDSRRFLAEFVSAMTVAYAASIAVQLLPDLNMARIIVGSLISLFPGLVFVNALHEVAQKNLSSGSARLLEACMIAINLSFGVAAALGSIRYIARMLA
ncbi:MAG: threonine/serine exporter family protein [Proteobacteria bacterium]|jgi:uncharacterized membrane protein YjjP (DUF1212 family)|nr:threonine/serine exporter family protein [Pseudomonadota bacterium]